ncbi:FBD-associated F-box protein [Apostasia shenzhenica]|uniref:FBD-associated F-box protein n=1 Tax=Apostasia shenzhenica TaxID=1088818 RepID=A0A2I0B6E4_9ASPA|nr:FBD-associated F-box protein [Apostasia shenzhenica]
MCGAIGDYTDGSYGGCHDDDAEHPLEQVPDDLLGHIVSFLPTRDAVRTSVLSRRWRYAWTHTTHFDFDPQTILSAADAAAANLAVSKYNYKNIYFAIDKCSCALDFILSLSPPLTIGNLRIMSPLQLPSKAFWIVDTRHPQLFALLRENPLRSSLLGINTLTSLEIVGPLVVSSRLVIACPILRSLKIARLLFEKACIFQQILSSCHKLEYLAVEECCNLDGQPLLNIQHQNLTRFRLMLGPRNTNVVIDTPSLVEFDLRLPGYICKDWNFVFLRVRMLERLALTLSTSNSCRGIAELGALAGKLEAVLNTVAARCNAHIHLEGNIMEVHFHTFIHSFIHSLIYRSL